MKVMRTQDAVGGRTDDFPALGMLFRAFLKIIFFEFFWIENFLSHFGRKRCDFGANLHFVRFSL